MLLLLLRFFVDSPSSVAFCILNTFPKTVSSALPMTLSHVDNLYMPVCVLKLLEDLANLHGAAAWWQAMSCGRRQRGHHYW